MDAGHLKGGWDGQMLIVTFKDANNTLVHLATAICEKENSDNYAWLYRQMKKNSDMNSVLKDRKTTIFTDKHKSHEPALAAECPDLHHKWCLRHLIGNLKQQVGQVNKMLS